MSDRQKYFPCGGPGSNKIRFPCSVRYSRYWKITGIINLGVSPLVLSESLIVSTKCKPSYS